MHDVEEKIIYFSKTNESTVYDMDFSSDRERCVILGEYIVKTGATVRAAAKEFKVSKSTVHKDVTEKLMHEDRALYQAVKHVLEVNKSERHLRGGEATKQKYLSVSNKSAAPRR